MTALILFLKRIPLWVWVVLALLGAGLFYGHTRYNAGQADIQGKFDAHLAADKEATDKANAAYRAKEQKDRDHLAEIGFQYERDKMAALDRKDAVIAELRDGTLKLRKQWRGCPAGLPGSSEGAGSADDAADLRNTDAGHLIGIAAACDSQIKGLQSVILTDRE